MAKKYYWLKFKEDFFKDKRIKKLRSIAGGDTYTIIYLKMQLLSLKNEGKLFYEGVDDSFVDELALDLDEDVENVKITVSFLLKNGLLVEENDEEYTLTETVKCIGSETDKAQLMRDLRARQNALKSIEIEENGNSVTNVLPKCYIENKRIRDRDKNIKENIIKEKYFENNEVNSLFLEFLKIRKKVKAVNSELAIKKLINKLNKYTDDIKIQMLEKSIVNSWKDVYEIKQKKETAVEKLQREIREAEEEERKQK